MIFVIVGSQKFPFERLLREVDRLIATGQIPQEVFAQIGVSEFEPEHMKWQRFLDKDTFDETIRRCDLLITHAGEGSIMTGLLMGKKVIAVPRYARLGEHVSDHQLEIARALAKQNCICNVEDIHQLGQTIRWLDEHSLSPYQSGRQTILRTIREFVG